MSNPALTPEELLIEYADKGTVDPKDLNNVNEFKFDRWQGTENSDFNSHFKLKTKQDNKARLELNELNLKRLLKILSMNRTVCTEKEVRSILNLISVAINSKEAVENISKENLYKVIDKITFDAVAENYKKKFILYAIKESVKMLINDIPDRTFEIFRQDKVDDIKEKYETEFFKILAEKVRYTIGSRLLIDGLEPENHQATKLLLVNKQRLAKIRVDYEGKEMPSYIKNASGEPFVSSNGFVIFSLTTEQKKILESIDKKIKSGRLEAEDVALGFGKGKSYLAHLIGLVYGNKQPKNEYALKNGNEVIGFKLPEDSKQDIKVKIDGVPLSLPHATEEQIKNRQSGKYEILSMSLTDMYNVTTEAEAVNRIEEILKSPTVSGNKKKMIVLDEFYQLPYKSQKAIRHALRKMQIDKINVLPIVISATPNKQIIERELKGDSASLDDDKLTIIREKNEKFASEFTKNSAVSVKRLDFGGANGLSNEFVKQILDDVKVTKENGEQMKENGNVQLILPTLYPDDVEKILTTDFKEQLYKNGFKYVAYEDGSGVKKYRSLESKVSGTFTDELIEYDKISDCGVLMVYSGANSIGGDFGKFSRNVAKQVVVTPNQPDISQLQQWFARYRKNSEDIGIPDDKCQRVIRTRFVGNEKEDFVERASMAELNRELMDVVDWYEDRIVGHVIDRYRKKVDDGQLKSFIEELNKLLDDRVAPDENDFAGFLNSEERKVFNDLTNDETFSGLMRERGSVLELINNGNKNKLGERYDEINNKTAVLKLILEFEDLKDKYEYLQFSQELMKLSAEKNQDITRSNAIGESVEYLKNKQARILESLDRIGDKIRAIEGIATSKDLKVNNVNVSHYLDFINKRPEEGELEKPDILTNIPAEDMPSITPIKTTGIADNTVPDATLPIENFKVVADAIQGGNPKSPELQMPVLTETDGNSIQTRPNNNISGISYKSVESDNIPNEPSEAFFGEGSSGEFPFDKDGLGMPIRSSTPFDLALENEILSQPENTPFDEVNSTTRRLSVVGELDDGKKQEAVSKELTKSLADEPIQNADRSVVKEADNFQSQPQLDNVVVQLTNDKESNNLGLSSLKDVELALSTVENKQESAKSMESMSFEGRAKMNSVAMVYIGDESGKFEMDREAADALLKSTKRDYIMKKSNPLELDRGLNDSLANSLCSDDSKVNNNKQPNGVFAVAIPGGKNGDSYWNIAVKGDNFSGIISLDYTTEAGSHYKLKCEIDADEPQNAKFYRARYGNNGAEPSSEDYVDFDIKSMPWLKVNISKMEQLQERYSKLENVGRGPTQLA